MDKQKQYEKPLLHDLQDVAEWGTGAEYDCKNPGNRARAGECSPDGQSNSGKCTGPGNSAQTWCNATGTNGRKPQV